MAERSIDPLAVQARLRRLLRQQRALPSGPWLHGEVARRMAERLALIRLRPERLVDWWGVLGASTDVLRRACPGARHTVVEPDAQWADLSRQLRRLAWWSARRWAGKSDRIVTQTDSLAAGSYQLVWSNMALHAVSDPPALFSRWHQALAVDGFVMFSCLGPDSLKQLRSLYARLGWAPPGIDFVDMHDLGDMLVHAGFADPVMDQETLTLTWATPKALLAELRSLGGNVHPGRGAALRGRGWLQGLEHELEALRGPSGRLELAFEVAYGHAFKAAPRPARSETTSVSLGEMRELLRAPRRPDPGPSGLR